MIIIKITYTSEDDGMKEQWIPFLWLRIKWVFKQLKPSRKSHADWQDSPSSWARHTQSMSSPGEQEGRRHPHNHGTAGVGDMEEQVLTPRPHQREPPGRASDHCLTRGRLCVGSAARRCATCNTTLLRQQNTKVLPKVTKLSSDEIP